MTFASAYRSKPADADGRFPYDAEECAVWAELVEAQRLGLAGRAWGRFHAGVSLLGLDRTIPQLSDLSLRLEALTGFRAVPVPAMIEAETFFNLLAERCFPVATFVRRRDEMEYLQEPDLFHEVYGHCSLLADQEIADLTQQFGHLGLRTPRRHWYRLQRLFWFTMEFGLIRSESGVRILGAGILSSPKESVLALESPRAERLDFDLETVMSTDYRIDRIQPRYFVLSSLEDLWMALDPRHFA
ncbi:MAG: phenylalanine 4-monooxygenase [Myxococcota bacterium]